MDRKDNELDALELSRRAIADLDELVVDFEIGSQSILRGLSAAQDQAQVEAMGMSARPFDEEARHKLADAIYLPILGGEVLRNGQRVASPTFTRRSLQRAIDAGYLFGVKHLGKLTVTIKDLRAWLDAGATVTEKSVPIAVVRTVSGRTARERERIAASDAIARQMLDSIKPKNKR